MIQGGKNNKNIVENKAKKRRPFDGRRTKEGRKTHGILFAFYGVLLPLFMPPAPEPAAPASAISSAFAFISCTA